MLSVATSDSPALVDVAGLQFALPGKQRRLGVDDRAHQRATFVAVDDVGLKQRQPAVQAVQQRVARRAGRQRLQPRQMVACRLQIRRVGDEVLVGVLRAGKARMVVADGHVGGPEQVFLGLVDGVVGVVQLVEIGAGVFHGVARCGGRQMTDHLSLPDLSTD